MAKRGPAAMTICSSAFTTLGRAQASALGHPSLAIAVIPHPFGLRTRDEVRQMAEKCVEEIVKLAAEAATA
jgi:hypothetical protein